MDKALPLRTPSPKRVPALASTELVSTPSAKLQPVAATHQAPFSSPTRPPPKKSEQRALPQSKTSRTIGALAFVDRDEEAFRLAHANLRNKRPKVSEHPTLVTAGQLFGAGKSQMGKHAVARVRVSREEGDHGIWARLLREGEDLAAVKDYAKAVTVMVDLKMHSPSSFAKLDIYLGYALYQSIRSSDESKFLVSWPDTEECEFRLPLKRVVKRFVAETGRSIFIHWDEVKVLSYHEQSHLLPQVGALELDQFDGCLGWPKIDDRSNLRLLLSRYYEFWDVVHPLLRMEHVYMFVTGKQTAFALLGYGLLRVTGGRTSPTRHLHLVLGALTPNDIKETYENTQLYETGIPLNAYVQTTTEELLDLLCKRICDLTAGLPRMVHACFEALCQLEDECLVLRSELDIDNALERAYLQITGHGTVSGRSDLHRHLMCSPEAINGPLSGAYSALLLASLLKLSLDASSEHLALGTGEELPLLRVVDKLDLFLDSHECTADQVRIRFAKWTMRHLLERRKDLDARLRPVLPLWSVPAEVLGKGEPLEWLVRTRLACVLAMGSFAVGGGHARTWAELFTVFRGTLLGDCAANLDTQHPVRCIPKVVKETSTKSDFSSAAPWSTTIGVADWPVLFESSTAFPLHTIGYPAPESHSPDVLVRCREGLVAAFQCKLGISNTTWSNVQDELDKTAHLLKACKTVCLVLVAFSLGAQLKDAFHAGDSTKLCLPAGKWALREKKLILLPSRAGLRGNDDTKLVLTVPDNMELVVLGDDGLNSFLGAESVSALRELIEARRDPSDAINSLQLSMSLLSPSPQVLHVNRDMAGLSLGPSQPAPVAAVPHPSPQALPPFELESFLRNEAEIDDEGVKKYLPLLLQNKIDREKVLMLLTNEDLKEYGVAAGGDRKMILAARDKRKISTPN